MHRPGAANHFEERGPAPEAVRMQLSSAQRASLNGTAALRRHIARTGRTFAGTRIWTPGELQILAAHWPNRSAILALLPDRSLRAIEHMATRRGLERKCLHMWTAAEAARFRRLWPKGTKRQLLEAFPFATWTSLSNYAQWQRANGYPNLFRPKVLPTPTGDALIDAIIEQAVFYNMSLRDLDAAAGTGRYFASGRHRHRRTWKHIVRAVELFGGKLDPSFPATAKTRRGAS